MQTRARFLRSGLASSLLPLLSGVVPAMPQQGPPRVVAWNDLGMHCLDPDFSVFSLLPPYNTFHAQLILGGVLQHQPGNYVVSYSALADPNGSINTSSIGKTNFWNHASQLFGVTLPPDIGLAGYAMPGPGNVPQVMGFDAGPSWFHATGVPITPRDDAQQVNPYPLMGITVRNGTGQVVTSTRTVVPNSEEMTCTECHAPFSNPLARPATGWVQDPDPEVAHRLNILRLHDERNAGDPSYAAALLAAGYAPTGLFDTVRTEHVAVMCDRCHFSNALGIGMPGIEPMTRAIHARHASALNARGETLESATTRSGCYSCHPGPETKCLRGAMGKAIAPSGDYAMECESCHGTMTTVGAATRNGWFEEPSCQSCHTGSATVNNGQIRYTSVFEPGGAVRQAVSDLFATEPDTPAPGISLFRFSTGHGGLQCAACHGPPHAEYPTSSPNDDLQMRDLQGHEGMLIECTTCHTNLEDNQIAGPHGMHPLTGKWVNDLHGSEARRALASCLACHNGDARGSVLSRAQDNRTYSTPFGAKQFWRGFQVSCYACHNGPHSSDRTTNTPPVVVDRTLATPTDLPASLTFTATDVNGDALSFQIVAQPSHGRVAFQSGQATYRADAGFTGTDTFTYAAWDGKANSNLGTVSVSVAAADCAGSVEAFGFGNVGSGGFMPRLSATGCVERGGQGAFVVDKALGGTAAVVVIGRGRAENEYTPGSVLRMSRILFRINGIPVTGSGAGQGGFVLPFRIPPAFQRQDLVAQVFVRDPAAPLHWSTTNALELRIR